jgi:putative membrane protein
MPGYNASGAEAHRRGECMSDLNDPRVFFAAERTLLAWNRTSIALMAFGFVLERFGLLMHLLLRDATAPLQRGLAFYIGIAFIALGAVVSIFATIEYRRVLKELKPVEIPNGYHVNLGVMLNVCVCLLAAALIAYIAIGFH